MIKFPTQVMSIVKITKMDLIDHNKPDLKGAFRDVIFITLANGDVKRLDLYANEDVTTIDTWKYKKTKYSKEIKIFEHWDVSKIATQEED